MKILFDTNIILDVLLNRPPFVTMSANLLSSVEKGVFEGFLCASTITTLDYLITKSTSREIAKIEIQKLLTLFQIADVNSTVLSMAIDSSFTDFEDAVQYFSGKCCNINGLVARNSKDYKHAKLPIYTPDELWSIISSDI